MKRTLFILPILLLNGTCAFSQNSKIAEHNSATVKISDKVEIDESEPSHYGPVIVDLSIHPVDSSPKSFIISGRAISDNTGTAMEFIPLFFGYKQNRPYLVGMSDVEGKFSFRVWRGETLKEVQQPPNSKGWTVHTLDLEESSVYLDGAFNGNYEMTSCSTSIYHLRGVPVG